LQNELFPRFRNYNTNFKTLTLSNFLKPFNVELLASITSTFNFYEPYLTSEWPHDDDGHSRWQPQDQACGRGHPRLPQALPIPLHITQGRIQGIWKFDFISLNCNSYFNHVTIHKICYNSTHFSQSPYSDKRMYLAYFTIWLRNGPIT
jgi:hypothetical protein